MSNAALNAVSAEAARKMAIVDAMTPAQRAVVHEIGLNAFSKKFSVAYKAAKKRAGITTRCRFTQHKTASKMVAA